MSSHSEEVRGVTDKSVKIGVIGDLTEPVADIWIFHVPKQLVHTEKFPFPLSGSGFLTHL